MAKKTKPYTLSISPEYQTAWGLKEAARELIANALDAKTRGASPAAEIVFDSGVLNITSPGVRLPLSALLMGESTSRQHVECIGQFGEGLTLALLVLARLGLDVHIDNDGEIWEPGIRKSPDFGTDVLMVEVTPRLSSTGRFSVRVFPVPETVWYGQISPLLFENYEGCYCPTAVGDLIISEEDRGRIYVNGMYVSQMPMRYGYNLMNVKLGRDRDVIDPAHLAPAVQAVLEACDDPTFGVEIAHAVLDGANVFEVTHRTFGPEIYPTLADLFRERWPNGVPCSSRRDAVVAEAVGFVPVQVSYNVRDLLKTALGIDYEALRQSQTDIVEDLTELAKTNTYSWPRLQQVLLGIREAIRAFASPHQFTRCLTLEDVRVVRFRSDNIMAAWFPSPSGNYIALAEDVFDGDECELINTIVHELAHEYGADGDPHHYEAQLEILSCYSCYLKN